MFGKVSKTLSKLVYPDGLCCLSCEAEIFDGKDSCFCEKCRPQKNEHYCKRCGVGLPNSTQDYCKSCLYIGKEDLYFDVARAPFLYRDPSVKIIVHNLKYNNYQYLAEYMSKPMIDIIRNQNWKIDVITYVPLHRRKQRKRGYNQSECLAECIAKSLNVPLVTTLQKTVYSKVSATKLGRDERRKLLDGTFRLTEEDIKGKNVLLVDDVMTSKATANECSKMLKSGKAKNVYVITYATSRGDIEQTY